MARAPVCGGGSRPVRGLLLVIHADECQQLAWTGLPSTSVYRRSKWGSEQQRFTRDVRDSGVIGKKSFVHSTGHMVLFLPLCGANRKCAHRELHALRCIHDCFPLRPPCRLDAPAQFGQFRFRNIHVKRTELEAGSGMAESIQQGWPIVLSSLKSLLETGQVIDVFAMPKAASSGSLS
jgi:hypothetical protein